MTGLLLAGFIAALGVRYYVRPPIRTWTDGGGIAVPDQQASLRQVLWTRPQTMGLLFNTTTHEYAPAVAPDSNALYFVRGAADENPDLYVSYKRNRRWTVPTPITEVNTEHHELGPRLSPDGRWLAFYSNRPGGRGGYDIWVCRRGKNGWSAPRNAGEPINTSFDDVTPAFSHDGNTIYFSSERWQAKTDDTPALAPHERYQYDLFAAAVEERQHPKKPVTLVFTSARRLASANTSRHDETAPSPSPDGRFLYYASNRPGGHGKLDLYRLRLNIENASTENLGPRINTSANETSPFVSLSGYQLHLASDRTGTTGGYDLYQSVTREVYADLTPGPPPRIGWHWWALGVALVLMFVVAVYLRQGGYGRLGLLQKCVFISLVVHVLLTALLSVVVVSQEILHVVAPEAGMTTTVNLDAAREIEVALQVRHQLTTLPVADPTLARQSKARPSPVARTAPEPTEVALPRVSQTPRSRAHKPVAPRIDPPQPVDKVMLAAPRELAEVDRFSVVVPAPVSTSDDQLPARDATPVPVPMQSEAGDTTAAPVDTHLQTPPAQPTTRPLVHVLKAIRPPMPNVEPLAPQTPGPVQVRARLQQIELTNTQTPIAADQAESPRVEPTELNAARYETATPSPAAQDAMVAVPTVEATEKSFVVAVTPKPQPAFITRPLVLDVPGASISPNIQMPSLNDAPPSEEAPLAADDDSAAEHLAAQPIDHTTMQTQVATIDPTAGVGPSQQAQPSLATQSVDHPNPLPAAGLLSVSPPDLQGVGLAAELGPNQLASPDWLFHRTGERRQQLLDEFGGTEASEAAVGKALKYLAKLQEKNGQWTLITDQHQPIGRFGHPVDTGVTGLATLCFLAANHRPDVDGPYREVVDRALKYLLDRQQNNGDLRGSKGNMYNQAIATLALAEAAAMTEAEHYRQAARLGAMYIIKAQNSKHGGWRYKPRSNDGDTSVLGWQILALHSVEQLDTAIPAQTREQTFNWLNAVKAGQHGVQARYQPKGDTKVTPAITAQAALSRMLLGERLTDQQRQMIAGNLLRQSPGRGKANYYYYYYASLVMMQIGGDAWSQWNDLARNHLVTKQVAKGKLAGSWSTNSEWGIKGGRIYTTAMATLTLQVYYRYLPMYRVDE